VLNNGTQAVDRNVQSFFIDDRYGFLSQFYIPANQNLTLDNAIIYEPHALITSEQRH